MEKIVSPGFLSGTLRMLPSKSASHRAVMMAAMAQGKTLLEPLQLSQDISATLSCAEGARVDGWRGNRPDRYGRLCPRRDSWRRHG